MIKPEQVPEAVVRKLRESLFSDHKDAACSIAAALNAWPGKALADGTSYYVPQILILPLPQDQQP